MTDKTDATISTAPDLRIGSLFSGIGGLELGLEWAGVGRTVWQVEMDVECQKVLANHWPDAFRYDDVTTLDWSEVEPADVICGGFPCQPFSTMGKQKGTSDDRWLWPAFADAVRHVRPRYVVVENVPALLSERNRPAFAGILADLHSLGFDAEWSVVSACSAGAPHLRRRLFIVAHRRGERRQQVTGGPHGDEATDEAAPPQDHLARRDAAPQGREDWRRAEPRVGYLADGIPSGVARAAIRKLGNAVVPQVAEIVGRRIVALEQNIGSSQDRQP